MTADDFRAMALNLPNTAEAVHSNHPDFRVRGAIFATLGYPSRLWGMVALSPEQQARFCAAEPDVFVPVKGVWGREGATQVRLGAARKPSVRTALRTAWRYRAAQAQTVKKKAATRKRSAAPAPRSRRT
jgi:hypothetical protein